MAAATPVVFSVDYSAPGENDPGTTDYQYALLLVNRLGTIKQVSLMGSAGFGDFDFSPLPPGDYQIYGLSYLNANTPASVLTYLNSQVIGHGSLNDVAEIIALNNLPGVCLDLDNGAFAGHTTTVVITPAANDFYWVGGAGNWNDINHWATCSGCNPLTNPVPVVPGALNNVYFDEFSGFTAGNIVTISAPFNEVRSMDWTGVLTRQSSPAAAISTCTAH